MVAADAAGHPEHEAELADSVGRALLVVLEALSPAERLAFVLHDLFALPFDEVAATMGRSPAAVRQLASRARRRVQAPASAPEADRATQRRVVEAFLAASRGGDFQALVDLLAPGAVVRADAGRCGWIAGGGLRGRGRGRDVLRTRRRPGWPCSTGTPARCGRSTGRRGS